MSTNMVRRMARSHWMASLVAIGLVLPGLAPKPATGGLEGNVRDTGGTAVIGAQVRVENTSLGAVTDKKGHYRINNIDEGTIAVSIRFVGYQAQQVIDVKITAGRITTLDVTLEQQAVDIGELLVTSANPLVPRDAVTTKQSISGDYSANGGMNIRGGRDNEATSYIDGVPVSPGSRGSEFVGRAPDVSTSSLEESSVTTGASGAEFGNAQSGVIALGNQPNWWNRRNAAGEEYHRIYENRFLDPTTNPLSTFSIDVDAGSYTNVRRFLSENSLPPADAVRIEEFINYFHYDYPEPTGEHPFSVTLEQSACPWNQDHKLLLVGLQGKHLEAEELPPSNLVFLIDVSGSMASEDKLPLVKQSFRLMVPRLRAQDRVAIVVYAGAAGLVLPSTPGNRKSEILASLDHLEAGGSTAGAAGIQLAYQIARENFMPRGNNRVILATDGDFNVGPSSEAELVRMIEEQRDGGTFLTVLGFGTGNLRDGMMEQLADKGNGHYGYVDNLDEGRKVFGDELSGTLYTIAKDVKLQIEFNPLEVKAYRLVGYENRVLAKEDFDNDRKDAGDMGAGHSVTALYEIVPALGEEVAEAAPGELRYQNVGLNETARRSGEWLTVKLRYKSPKSSTSKLFSRTMTNEGLTSRPSANFRFASAVAEFGLLLRNSEYRKDASAPRLIARARGALGNDPEGYRAEFVQLVERWRQLRGLSDTTE